MSKALVIGAGMVARPLVRYLLEEQGCAVTVADMTVSRADALVSGHPYGRTTELLVDDTAKLGKLISEHDLAVSLLPAHLQPVVAQACIKHRKNVVTTSYVSPEMSKLDGPARDAGVVVLNEMGVDPGIDHMSAMRIIHDVKERGGEVTSFKSYCGGLPAPDCNDNPWGYKFSWSPRAVCTAGKNAARYREDGREVNIPGPDLFLHHHKVPVEGLGELEAYPNRDSLSYLSLYGLENVATMFRGTFRNHGWCDSLKQVVDLGMLDETPVTYPAGTTFAQWIAGLMGQAPAADLRKELAAHLGLEESADVLERFEWLGLLSEEQLPIVDQETTALDVLAARMGRKMVYAPGERDMIVLCHYFTARFPDGSQERITSTLIDYGQPNGDSSMARTVGLPAAIGAAMILNGKINTPGVQVPVEKAIYKPVLDELETMGIRCVERTTPGPS
ncbi:MAG: saccharopine dehydrogenase [bacterium]|nr:saccharopine dehydrogenase [bacterium]